MTELGPENQKGTNHLCHKLKQTAEIFDDITTGLCLKSERRNIILMTYFDWSCRVGNSLPITSTCQIWIVPRVEIIWLWLGFDRLVIVFVSCKTHLSPFKSLPKAFDVNVVYLFAR